MRPHYKITGSNSFPISECLRFNTPAIINLKKQKAKYHKAILQSWQLFKVWVRQDILHNKLCHILSIQQSKKFYSNIHTSKKNSSSKYTRCMFPSKVRKIYLIYFIKVRFHTYNKGENVVKQKYHISLKESKPGKWLLLL